MTSCESRNRQERELEVEAMEDRISKPPKFVASLTLDPKLLRSLTKHLKILTQGVAMLEDKVSHPGYAFMLSVGYACFCLA